MVFLAGCALALVHAAHFRHVSDDAFISFQYAHNFARGLGLSFNPGDRTMGYSDLLWVLLIAVFDRIGFEAPTAGKVLGTACAWGTLLVLYRHLRRQYTSLWPAAAGIGVLVANGTFALWMFGGLEGHLFGLLIAYAVVTTLEVARNASSAVSRQGAIRIGMSLGLCSMTRPEGLLFAAPVCAFILLRADRHRWRMVGVISLIAACATGAVTIWQWVHYGAPVPNTYYAKTLPLSWPLIRRGLYLTRDFVCAYYGLPVGIVVAAAWLTERERAARTWLPLFVIGTFLVFYLRIGGDALVYYRMWLPMLPMFGLLAGEVVGELGESRSRSGAPVAPIIAVMFVALGLPASLVGADIRHLRDDDRNLKNLELVVTSFRALPRDTVLAANVVGIAAYYSELRLIDMLGLNDAHIARSPKDLGIPAHESHDGAYVLSRNPDIILPAFPLVYPSPPSRAQIESVGYPSDRDLFSHPSFASNYRLVQLPIEKRGYFPVFVRNGYPVDELTRLFPPVH